jgi:hypothetical protein
VLEQRILNGSEFFRYEITDISPSGLERPQ